MEHGKKQALLVILIAGVLAASCRKAATVFLDLPEEPKTEQGPAGEPRRPAGVPSISQAQDTLQPRPAIEATLDPDSALAMLPRDPAGNVDWVAALRDGTIDPRWDLPGAPRSNRVRFAFDFYFKGLDAYFPHSSHAEWLNCESCHGSIYRYRGETTTMDAINKGESCGRCHGTVAFAATTCERCHAALTMPEARPKAEFLGDLTMTRSDSVQSSSAFPPAQFPHWVHRIRYRCTACHTSLFDTRAGSAILTMAELGDGKACGACHDGRSAFTLVACDRCHVAAQSGESSKQ